MAGDLHLRYRRLVADIEGRFPVTDWSCGDLALWPLMRAGLYQDMYWQSVGGAAPVPRPWPLRLIALVLRPLVNLWRSRGDLAHLVLVPRRAHAVLLGDGTTLDRVEGVYQDRFGEPLIAALAARGRSNFLMQSGDLSRLPWRRPTFAASQIQAWGDLTAFAFARALNMPGLAGALDLLAAHGVAAPSWKHQALARQARQMRAQAWLFGLLLAVVRPVLAFVVSYHVGLGPAFLLACHRRGILSIDLQRCPQESAQSVYDWPGLPSAGYAVLPKLFWTWTQPDARRIETWASASTAHRALHGGHLQLAAFQDAGTEWDRRFFAAAGAEAFEREILVTLQPLAGKQKLWEELAAAIAAAPKSWRWWIRRHPASRAWQDREFGTLLTSTGRNIRIAEASALPLPVLLRHMHALVCLASGAAAEAAMIGVPAFFLEESAADIFPGLLARGEAKIVAAGDLPAAVAGLAPRSPPPAAEYPPIDTILDHIEEMAKRLAVRKPLA